MNVAVVGATGAVGETIVKVLRERNVPLVVPEINAQAIQPQHRLFPVGNCTAIILCVALAPVRDAAGLASVNVATYQAVSGAGRAALEEFDAGKGPFVNNVVPQVGDF